MTENTAVADDEDFADDFGGEDPFDSPGKVGGKFPTLAQLQDRLLICKVVGSSEQQNYNKTGMVTRYEVDVTVLTGDTITVHVDKHGNETELPDPIKPGGTLRKFYISQTVLGNQLNAVPRGSLVLGRLVKLPSIPGSSNERAWALTDTKSIASGSDNALSDVEKRYGHIKNLAKRQEAIAAEVEQAKADLRLARQHVIKQTENVFES